MHRLICLVLLVTLDLSSATADEPFNSKDYLRSISCDASDLTPFQKFLFQLSPQKDYKVEECFQLLMKQNETMIVEILGMVMMNKNQTVNELFQFIRQVAHNESSISVELSDYLIAFISKITYLKLSAGLEGAKQLREGIDMCKIKDSKGCHLSPEDAKLITEMAVIEGLCAFISETLPQRTWAEIESLDDMINRHSEEPHFAKYAFLSFTKWFDNCIEEARSNEEFSLL